MTIGERIRELRKAKGLTQEQLAELIEGDGNTISRWEHNKIGIGNAYIIKLAKTLNTTADYLLGKDVAVPQEKNDPPASERSVVEKNRGRLMYVFQDGEKLELPDTERGYALFEKIWSKKAASAKAETPVVVAPAM